MTHRNAIVKDPYTYPIMAFDSASNPFISFLKKKLSSSDFDTARRLAKDSNAGGSVVGKPEAEHNTAKDTVPGDLSELSHLNANPSYVKTLRDNNIPSLNKLPAEDDGETAVTWLDAATVRSLLAACQMCEQGKLKPQHMSQFVRWVLTDVEPPAETATTAMDSALTSKYFPHHDRIGDTATVDLREPSSFRFQGKAN